MTKIQEEHKLTSVTHSPDEPVELIKLIRKLHWIGMDEEARQLEDRLNSYPSSRRPSVLRDPFSTD
jgi:hypothetical protein